MKKRQSTRRNINLLLALELLDEMVRKTSIGPSYVDSTAHQAVAEAIRRARKRSQIKGVKPREDQLSLLAATE